MHIPVSVVVDASVMGAVFFNEPEAKSLENQLMGNQLFVPELFDYEMASIYLKKQRRHPELQQVLEQSYQTLLRCQFNRIRVLMGEAVLIAEKFHLTIYDASYFWLAKRLQLELLSLDKQLKKTWLEFSQKNQT